MIVPQDNSFHKRNDSPYWNESAYFSFMVPEQAISGIFYFWHRPNMNLTAGGVAVWDSDVDVPECLIYEFDHFQPLEPGSDMHDFSLESGLSIETREPLQSYRLAYKSGHCELELDWEAIWEPVENSPTTSQGVDHATQGWMVGHYDQGGRVRGHVAIEGRSWTVDCFSHRDQSWGPRRVNTSMPRQGYSWGTVSAEHGFFVHSVNDVPDDQDGLLGTVEGRVKGYYMKDGVRSALRSGERAVTERAPTGMPLRLTFTGEDELGRVLQAEGRCLNAFRYVTYNSWMNNWCLTRWEFDGQVGWGEEQDFVHLHQHRRCLQTIRANERAASSG